MIPFASPPIIRPAARPSGVLARGAVADVDADADAEAAEATRRAIEDYDNFFDEDSFELFDPPTPAPIRFTAIPPPPTNASAPTPASASASAPTPSPALALAYAHAPARFSSMAPVQRSRQLERTPSYNAPTAAQLVSPVDSPDNRQDTTVVGRSMPIPSKRQRVEMGPVRMHGGAREPFEGRAVDSSNGPANQTPYNLNMMLPTPNTSFMSNAASPRANNVPNSRYYSAAPPQHYRRGSFPLPPPRQTSAAGQRRSRPLLAGRTSRRNYSHNLYSDPDIPWAEGRPPSPPPPPWRDLETLAIKTTDEYEFLIDDPWEGIDWESVDLDGYGHERDMDNSPRIAGEGVVSAGDDDNLAATIISTNAESTEATREDRQNLEDTRTATILPQDGPELCPEQRDLVNLILSGKNVFYTGSAGCGKSTVLRAFVKELRDSGQTVHIVAPTGRAALDIDGQTTWTYAGLTPNLIQKEFSVLLRRVFERDSIRVRFWETDVLVIDEISMVENHQLERLDLLLRKARSYYLPHLKREPFGGVQIVITGDFCQLPPVKPFANCIRCGEATEEDVFARTYQCFQHDVWRDDDKWAFRSQAWRRANFHHVYLETIHRQTDRTFINILQHIRMGRAPTTEQVRTLMRTNQLNADGPARSAPQLTNAVNLYPTRKEVDNHNRAEFIKLRSEPYQYRCLDTFEYCGVSEDSLPPDDELPPELVTKKRRNKDGTLKILDDHKFEPIHELKLGTLVVLLHNLDLSAGLCNGSQGIVCGFEDSGSLNLPKFADGVPHGDYKELEVKKYVRRQAPSKGSWPIVKFLPNSRRSEITLTIYPECLVNELECNRQTALVSRTQVPLAQAWAMTIHRSQGMTLDRVTVDVTRAWEKGQVYVALSRATSLEGLMVKGSPSGLSAGVGGDPTVQWFLKKNFPSLRDPDEQYGSDDEEEWSSISSLLGSPSPAD